MGTQRLTVAQAIVAHLIAQTTELGDGSTASLFPGVYGIFGHGNVTCLGHALEERKDELADVARSERAGHGACRDRVQQGGSGAGKS